MANPMDSRTGQDSGMSIFCIGQLVIAEHLQGGAYDGELRTIPHIPLIGLEGDLAFNLTCRWFLVRFCFAHL